MEKTSWKKNIDSRYISGEDLVSGLRGLKKEMVVTIEKGVDAPTFDQSTQKEVTKSALWLVELGGQKIYKPVLLNKTNAKFFQNEFKSEFIEDWFGKPVILYACPDKRFGFVARFKKYYPPATIDDKNAIAKLNKCENLEQLAIAWGEISVSEQQLPTVLSLKNNLKNKLK